jgi:hypothetical protein
LSPASLLDGFQSEILDAFFRREARFFLTGGAALAGYHLGHRRTQDLDLFTTASLLDEGDQILRSVADELGAVVEAVRTSPEFRRRLVRRGGETVLVDLVWDRAPQLFERKPRVGRVYVDPPEEILANKLCALLSRSELRDLVDVRALEAAGFPMESALPGAARKDGGFTPGQLAWVLSQIVIGDDARPPGDATPQQLRSYLTDLIARLSRASFPRSD